MSKDVAIQQQALTNAVMSQSTMNYGTIISEFAARGIPVDEIVPRDNVFSYNAWLALGRQVRRGEHGVKVVTFRKGTTKDKKTGEERSYSRPWSATVFHVSQTDPVKVN